MNKTLNFNSPNKQISWFIIINNASYILIDLLDTRSRYAASLQHIRIISRRLFYLKNCTFLNFIEIWNQTFLLYLFWNNLFPRYGANEPRYLIIHPKQRPVSSNPMNSHSLFGILQKFSIPLCWSSINRSNHPE